MELRTPDGITFGALRAPLGCLTEPVSRLLARSVAKDPDNSLSEVMADIDSGKAIAWVASEGPKLLMVCVTQLFDTASGKQCLVYHLAGEGMDRWLHFGCAIEEWARSQGCTSMETIGRGGWQRKLRALGWRRKAVVLRKDL